MYSKLCHLIWHSKELENLFVSAKVILKLIQRRNLACVVCAR